LENFFNFVSKKLTSIDTYLTLNDRTEGTYKEKKSTFIAIAQACYSEEEAKTLLHTWRKEHHKSRHLCYAYRFGLEKKIFRANDDGEPTNSAGQPILGQIQAFDLTNVLIGVVRYYGGVKLGVGGLIQAYKTVAKTAIENGQIIEKQVFQHFLLQFDYADLPEIMNICKQLNAEQSKQDFGLQCQLEIALELKQIENLQEKIKLMSVKLDDLGVY